MTGPTPNKPRPAGQHERRSRRGQPLIVLGTLMLSWISARAILWEDLPWPTATAPTRVAMLAPRLPQAAPTATATSVARPAPEATVSAAAQWPTLAAPLPAAPQPASGAGPAPATTVGTAPPTVVPTIAPTPAFEAAPPAGNSTAAPVTRKQPVTIAGAHTLLWLAGMAQLPAPAFVANATLQPLATPPAKPAAGEDRRWSADGWLMLRQGGTGIGAGGLLPPSYGASQAGAVIRYRLAPDSGHRPAAYLRATSALRAPRGEEAALGLALRPLAGLPLSAQAELRATRMASGTVIRPAIGLVTELNRFHLPAGLTGEAYGQAGVVGGPGGSAYADGQVRVERSLTRWDRGELRLGVGAWGGAQRGAARVDLGPAAALDIPLGAGRARIAADWRLRVAGNAAPESGPALTLSAGF